MSETVVVPCGSGGTGPSTRLVFTDDQDQPAVQLGFAVPSLAEAATQVERLDGQIERDGPLVVRCRDSQGVPLWLRADETDGTGWHDREARGVLGVIFMFAENLDRAAEFYQAFAGWAFEPIGRDKDILFARNGPAVGIRPASKAPAGASGTVTFHVSVPDAHPVISAIQAGGGRGTLFSLWYRPAAQAQAFPAQIGAPDRLTDSGPLTEVCTLPLSNGRQSSP
jgi:predicted enzyme related to lactoylglutathione lyase